MADPDPNSSISGVEDDAGAPEPSLREIAEKAYDEGSTESPEAPSDGRARDSQGRFAPKEARTGEAEREAPSPENAPEAQARTDPAQDGNRPPDHWSAEDRAVFERLPPDAKQMLQRRYSEMEADYTRKSQANAAAVSTINQLTPVFIDPVIRASLQEAGLHPVQAIHEWASMHKRAMSPNVQDKAALMIEFAERMGFDPARLFAINRPPDPNLPPGAEKDPAVKYIADLYGKTVSEMKALENKVTSFERAKAEEYEAEALKVTRWGIDKFADEKGPDGKLLRPDFDKRLPYILELFKADPDRDLAEAYQMARRMDPDGYKEELQAELQRLNAQKSNERARAANRGNLRGITSPVSKPTERPSNGSLRDTLEASADEVGF